MKNRESALGAVRKPIFAAVAMVVAVAAQGQETANTYGAAVSAALASNPAVVSA